MGHNLHRKAGIARQFVEALPPRPKHAGLQAQYELDRRIVVIQEDAFRGGRLEQRAVGVGSVRVMDDQHVTRRIGVT